MRGYIGVLPSGDFRDFVDDDYKFPHFWLLFFIILSIVIGVAEYASAAVAIPGSDVSNKLEAAGSVLRLVDTAVFTWGARIFAGLCVLSSGWNLKEQRFGIAIICLIAAIILGTATTWVKNIFAIGGGSVFG